MTRGFEAITSVRIDAPAAKVWRTLTDPDLVRHWMHGTTVATDWQVGSPITWTGEWNGKPYQDKGTVLEVVPQVRLVTTHWSPMGGSEDKPENYHTVAYDMASEGDSTRLTLTQDNNPDQQAADRMARENWAPVLEGLKTAAETD